MIIRGQIYLADMTSNFGNQIQKNRPVVVIQNNTGNEFSDTVIVACLTSLKQNRKKLQPTQFVVKSKYLPRDSVVLCEQIYTINKTQLISYITKLSETDLQDLNQALRISLNIFWLTNLNSPFDKSIENW